MNSSPEAHKPSRFNATRWRRLLSIALLILGAIAWVSVWNTSKSQAQPNRYREYNGFNLSQLLIPKGEILRGGPPRDGIPSIDAPDFVEAAQADWMHPDDDVLAFELNGAAKAYPLKVLVWHEVVNDDFGGTPVLATYCPLCGTAMMFKRSFDGQALSFGVSGLLYQSDVLMYDRESESLWSQLKMQSVSGPKAGTPLKWIPAAQTKWSHWLAEHPETLVLAGDMHKPRRTGQPMPYQAYFASDATMFPVAENRLDLPRKSWVIGVIVDGVAMAFPLDRLKPNGVHQAQVETEEIVLRWDAANDHALVRDSSGAELPSVRVYWFAWQAFYPDTLVYEESKAP
ncbi:DUF3179 domain-containing protein [bacterium]|nr:DUF3179 domain-containing protein [bacterium]